MYNSKKTRYGSRGFIIALFFVCLISGTTGCSEKGCSEKEDGYSQAYDDLFNILEKMNASSDEVCEMTYYFVDDAGASAGMSYMAAALTVQSAEDVGKTPDNRCMAGSLYGYLGIDDSDMLTYETVMDYGMRTGSYEKVYNKCTEIQENYNYLVNTKDTIEQQMLDFKEQYGEKHKDGVDSLKEYYLETVSYADFALEPSGTVGEYSSTCSEFQNNVEKTKSSAKIDK